MRLAIVAGICIEHDAISSAVVGQAEIASNIAGIEAVDVFLQHVDREICSPVHSIDNPWKLLSNEAFQRADVAIFHFGIHYSIFDAIVGLDPGRTKAVVHFHNITPVDLVDEADRDAIERSHQKVVAAQTADTDYWYYSEFNRRTLLDWGINPKKMSFVPFPIEPPRALRPTGGDADELSLLSVGRLTPAKGTHVILRAMADARSRIDRPIHLTIVGNRSLSEPAYIEKLDAMLDSFDLRDAVSFEVDADDKEMWECYERADVVVSASLHEGLCVPIIEGYLAGCRAIGTTAGNLPFVVQAPDPVVRPDDSGELAAAIARIDSELRAGLHERRDAARELCLRHSRDSSLRFMSTALGDRVRRRDPMTNASVDVARRQDQLFDLLACPVCRAALRTEDAVVRTDGMSAADLVCDVHGRVGVVDQHRPSFLNREIDVLPAGSASIRTTEIEAPAEFVSTSGRWWPIAEGWAGAAEPGVAMVVDGDLAAASFDVQRDRWSPVVDLVVDGEVIWREDLSDEGGTGAVSCSFQSCQARHIELRVADPVPSGRVVITGTRVRIAPSECAAPVWGPINRGNPFPQGFIDLLDEAPADCVALDCGGGDRRLGDPRLFNLEYLPYDAPDLYGDGLALPFANGAFDLLLSQAVLEHVTDPQLAVDEMHRILRPGGRIFCEMAFTQPLHAVPSHYFNITPHGAAHLFRDWDIEVLDWFGGVAATVEWWMQILDLDSRWDAAKSSKLRELLGEIDTLTDHRQLQHFASGVMLIATRTAD